MWKDNEIYDKPEDNPLDKRFDYKSKLELEEDTFFIIKLQPEKDSFLSDILFDIHEKGVIFSKLESVYNKPLIIRFINTIITKYDSLILRSNTPTYILIDYRQDFPRCKILNECRISNEESII
jgi:phage FluMu protein Com